MLLASLIGTLSGSLVSILPGILSFLQKREELRYEAKLFELRAKYQQVATQAEIDLINARADAVEGDSLRRHDASLTEPGFIGALRRSVRPVITYLFFFLFVFVKVVALVAAYQASGEQDWVGNSILWTDLLPIIWDEQTSAIFGAIIGFWFGSRTIEKLMRR